MNSLFKPYLPVDEEGFVTITDSNDILNKEYGLSPLIRCLKKAELHSEVQQNEEEEVIVLTDDEHERDDESLSNQGGSSATFSNHDESNEFDWYSASSQQASYHSQNIIETVSIDSPPPPPYKQTPSLSSLDSCDLNLDTTNSLATDRNSGSVSQPDETDAVIGQQQNLEAMPSTSQEETPEMNGENRGLSALDESMFNRLVNDINSTHVSVPGNGNLSSDSKINENGGESTQTAESGENVGADKATVENDQLNRVFARATGSGSSAIRRTNGESPVSDQSPNHRAAVKLPDPSEPVVNICDTNTNIISSGSLLRNHEETLKNIEEIVTDDLKKHGKPPKERSTSRGVVTRMGAKDVKMGLSEESTNDSDTVQETTPQDFVPAAESTVTETSLLSKSEQDVLFKDRDAALIFTDLWNNGQPEETAKSEDENKSIRDTNDTPSPITFLQNGIDPSLRMKTYARSNRRIETKTISTQTSRHSLSGCPSPVTTIDESDNRRKDKHLLTQKANLNDDELFLRDIFTTPEVPPRSGGSPRIWSPMYLASTPVASTPIASTSSAVPKENESLQTTIETSSYSVTGSAEVAVKRKRGRPRKYPLPEPGTITPVVPKPPRAPRQPRKPRTPKPPKDPNESGEVEVFERMKLRERKPKVVPPPPPPPQPKKKSISRRTKSPKKQPKAPVVKEKMTVKDKEREKDRKRRRNTIKMTIDAILNTQSTNFSAIQARRISQILGFPISAPQIATILKRRNYDKSESVSMLQTFRNRSNGQMNSTEPIATTQSTTSTPSTILARKTYIKPNITFSTLSSFSSALRRISRLNSARRTSFSTRRISFSSSVPRHPVLVNTKRGRGRPSKQNSPQKSIQSQQRYEKIDVFDTSTKSKRGRKKGSKDTKPRKRSTPKRKNESSKIIVETTNPIVEVGDKANETIELVDLTKEIAPFELDATEEMDMQFGNIDTVLSSTQHIHNDSESYMKRRPNFLSDDETDVTNEFTTDPESTVEDTDDSRTRKSKRSRKRPKILDL